MAKQTYTYLEPPGVIIVCQPHILTNLHNIDAGLVFRQINCASWVGIDVSGGVGTDVGMGVGMSVGAGVGVSVWVSVSVSVGASDDH